MSDASLIRNARVLTLAEGPTPRRGVDARHLGEIDRGWVRIEDGRIAEVGEEAPDPSGGHDIDADGRVLMPAFIDCHTHTCWAGSRFDEFEQRLGGASYLETLKAGGGIMSTVRAVREAGEDELTDGILRRLDAMAALGTAAVEIKSGYGLTTEDELKMLRAIDAAARQSAVAVRPTFLGAHAIDPDQPDFVRRTINETLPAVVEAFPGITCDAYCEDGAWSLDQAGELFERARSLGCPLRVHTDQFNDLGMTALAIEMGAISVDHLEASTAPTIDLLSRSDTIGVALPCSGFHLDDRYAPGRDILDNGGALAIATNYNPGSAPTPSIPFTIALACRKLRLMPAEAITAATINAACVLGLQERMGTIEVGKRADLQLLDCTDERELAYEFATAGPMMVMLGGKVVHERGVVRR